MTLGDLRAKGVWPRGASASTTEVKGTPNMEHRIYATTRTQYQVKRVIKR